jgi:hypothetical protein
MALVKPTTVMQWHRGGPVRLAVAIRGTQAAVVVPQSISRIHRGLENVVPNMG